MPNKLFHNPVLLLLPGILSSCGGSSSSPPGDYTAFGTPELVTVNGYSGDVMEPFISRDGAYLFFNDHGSAKDIFYATFIDDITFDYQGPIAAINTAAVEGVPTMDNLNNFYYVSTFNYDPPSSSYDTIYSGTWTGTTVNGSAAVTGLAITTPGFVNFDIEIGADGSTLYFDDGFFSGNPFPDTANISVAVRSGGNFVRPPDSGAIMANVNTSKLEYAPAVSKNDLELFFYPARP